MRAVVTLLKAFLPTLFQLWLLGAYPAFAKVIDHRELNIAVSAEFSTLNPLMSSNVGSSYLMGFCHRPLAYTTEKGELVPILAKEIPSIANKSAQIVTIGDRNSIRATWEILPEAVWGDGKPITGHDFLFSWKAGLGPTVTIADRKSYEEIENVEVDRNNPKRFTVFFKRLSAEHARTVSYIDILPKHIEEQIYSKHKSVNFGYERHSQYQLNPRLPGLYSGPYLPIEISLGSHVTLQRNPRYWGKSPAFDRINIKLISNTSAAEAALLAGNVDLLSGHSISFDQALEVRKRIAAKRIPYQVNFVPALVYEHIDLNLNNPILQDRRVRQALLYGLDRDQMVEALFQGRQPVAHHFVPTSDTWYTEDPGKISIYRFSRRKANRLLEESGWILRDDGLRYKNGQKLSLLIQSTAEDKTREMVETYLQDQWKRIGVELSIKNVPARVFFSETLPRGQFSGLAMYAWMSLPQVVPRQTLHSANIPNASNGWSGNNNAAWRNRQVDGLVDGLESELDDQKRLQAMHQILKIYTDELPSLPLYYRSKVSVIPKALVGYTLPPHNIPESLFVENWRISRPISQK